MVGHFLLAVLLAAPAPVEGPPPAAVLKDWRSGLGAVQGPAFLGKQVELLRSKEVLRAAVRCPGIASLPCLRKEADPAAWLRAQLKIQIDEASGTIRLSISDGSRRERARLANAVARAYLEELARQLRRPIEVELERKVKELIRQKEALQRHHDAIATQPHHHSPEIKDIDKRLTRALEAALRADEISLTKVRDQLQIAPRVTLLRSAELTP